MNRGGIVFFRTGRPTEVERFYTDRLGAAVAIDQPDCTVLAHEGFHFGFCDRPDPETEGTLTFVVPDREAVEAAHERLADVARGSPHDNDRYGIYQFFASDPEGRTVEVQCFEPGAGDSPP
jgi:hypothetical protein